MENSDQRRTVTHRATTMNVFFVIAATSKAGVYFDSKFDVRLTRVCCCQVLLEVSENIKDSENMTRIFFPSENNF